MEKTVAPHTVTERPARPGTGDRPALADLVRLDAGELTRRLELALPGAGARAVSPFNSSI
ncbi:hypothetical protein ACFCX4_09315 [Kitasatospora sp. NPDC056327]|uniref:hypothetical protein n=1 Tax=Kitasatospora sp. NPDC056327 TaxID=3345785 RepID=UPI0035E2219E